MGHGLEVAVIEFSVSFGLHLYWRGALLRFEIGLSLMNITKA